MQWSRTRLVSKLDVSQTETEDKGSSSPEIEMVWSRHSDLQEEVIDIMLNQGITNRARKGIAVVTGASSGLGSVYASRLAARGYDLFLVARRRDRLDEVAKRLRSEHGVDVRIAAADLSVKEHLDKVADDIAHDSAVTLLVNNAGTAKLVSLSRTLDADQDSMIDVNAKALTRLSLAILPGFKERNLGTIINIGSVLAFHTLPISGVYSGTKAYVMNFTWGLQQEVAGTNIVVQLVLPATTATDIWEIGGVPLSALDQASIMTPDDCVDAALAGLDQGETVTLPSLDDQKLWEDYNSARTNLLNATQTGRPASRYQFAMSAA
jgi:short-subunit dehydrogenase